MPISNAGWRITPPSVERQVRAVRMGMIRVVKGIVIGQLLVSVVAFGWFEHKVEYYAGSRI